MTQYYDRHLRGQTRDISVTSHHTFSFGSFQSRFRSGVRNLIAINEDYILPNQTLTQIHHENRDVIIYGLNGEFNYQDDLGFKTTIGPNTLQHISTSKGSKHTKVNKSPNKQAHYIEIWIDPKLDKDQPSIEQIVIAPETSIGNFMDVVRPSQNDGIINLKHDTNISLHRLQSNEKLNLRINTERYGFLHIVSGLIGITGKKYRSGDGFAFKGDEIPISLTALSPSEILLFNLS